MFDQLEQKDIHIVFGKSAEGTFIYSKAFDMNTIQLICLEDCLNIGPICDLDSVEEIKKRNDWFAEVFYVEIPINEDIHIKDIDVNEDIEIIKKLVENYKNEKIYLWTGFCASDFLNTARLLYHLPAPCSNIFIVDFSKFSFQNIFGQVVSPKMLSVTTPSQVCEIAKCFYQLTDEKLSQFVKLWKKIKSGNAIVRILDKNGQIIEKEETYFDSLLESFCTSEFQKAARIIGQALGHLFHADHDFIGDMYLDWRLKQLSVMNKIEARGKLNGLMRDYEVKLIY